mmetsp:Transcript_13523/g.9745  ORF Transcript_13523/g.9745 Transcript_13523/m.9745 type:complete len:85 (+) Transcript_13523:353-607(+)
MCNKIHQLPLGVVFLDETVYSILNPASSNRCSRILILLLAASNSASKTGIVFMENTLPGPGVDAPAAVGVAALELGLRDFNLGG